MLQHVDYKTRLIAYRDTVQSLADSDYTTILYNSVYANPENEYDSGTGIFTSATTGFFTCKWSALGNGASWAAGEIFAATLSKNDGVSTDGTNMWWGFRWEAANATSAFYPCSNGSITVQLDAGEDLRIKVYHNQGAPLDLYDNENYNYFSIIKVGPQCVI